MAYSTRAFRGQVLAALVLALLVATEAGAQYFDGFESYTAGEDIAGLGGWETWDLLGGALDATVSDDEAHAGRNSLGIVTTTDIVQTFEDEFTEGRWTISCWVYVPGSSTGAAYFIALNTYTPSPTGAKNWSTQVVFDTATGDVSSLGGSGFALAGTGDLVVDAWVEVQVRVDLDENLQDIYYDGEPIASGLWQATGVDEISCIDLYGNTADPQVYFDDLAIFPDCNQNGVDDGDDIELGTSDDCDGDGVPDDCAAIGIVQTQRITASDADGNELFGNAISVSGNVAAVGARGDDEIDDNAGAVYVLVWDGAYWAEVVKLTASDGAAFDEFGYTVALDGDVLLVGARRDDDAGSNSGAAYVFRFDGDSWVEEQKLEASDAAAGVEFGYSVALHGDLALVGAWLADDSGTNSGSAYLYRYDGESWEEIEELVADGVATGDQFGKAVALHDDSAFVGAVWDDDLGSNAGAVYVFRDQGSRWAEEDKLLASDGEAADSFGISLAANCDRLLVGAALEDGAGTDVGAVYAFRRDSVEWSEEQKLTAIGGEAEDEFGTSIALSGSSLIVGAPGSGAGSGAAHLFVYQEDKAEWDESLELIATGGTAGESFGHAVGLNGFEFVIGALESDLPEELAGAIYCFHSSDCNGNGVPDNCDIESGAESDADLNGVPDGCESSNASDCEPEVLEVEFLRGDCDGNGVTSALLDALFLLAWQFVSGPAPPCLDAADVDGNNAVSALLDALHLLVWQFSGGPPPVTPGPGTCGADPDADTSLSCATAPAVCD